MDTSKTKHISHSTLNGTDTENWRSATIQFTLGTIWCKKGKTTTASTSSTTRYSYKKSVLRDPQGNLQKISKTAHISHSMLDGTDTENWRSVTIQFTLGTIVCKMRYAKTVSNLSTTRYLSKRGGLREPQGNLQKISRTRHPSNSMLDDTDTENWISATIQFTPGTIRCERSLTTSASKSSTTRF
jgi:hypothetical protein